MTGDTFECAIKKDIRNNPIVREVDRERHREMWRTAGIGLFLVSVLLFWAWQHFELLRQGLPVRADAARTCRRGRGQSPFTARDLHAAVTGADRTNGNQTARNGGRLPPTTRRSSSASSRRLPHRVPRSHAVPMSDDRSPLWRSTMKRRLLVGAVILVMVGSDRGASCFSR